MFDLSFGTCHTESSCGDNQGGGYPVVVFVYIFSIDCWFLGGLGAVLASDRFTDFVTTILPFLGAVRMSGQGT